MAPNSATLPGTEAAAAGSHSTLQALSRLTLRTPWEDLRRHTPCNVANHHQHITRSTEPCKRELRADTLAIRGKPSVLATIVQVAKNTSAATPSGCRCS